MKFIDVFPYDKKEYAFIIDFFEEYANYRSFAASFSGWAQGISCPLYEFAGINFPGDDQQMRCGPNIWEGPHFALSDQELGYHEFIVIMLLAAKVFLQNMRSKGITEYERYINLVNNEEVVHAEEGFLKDVELFRKNFSDVLWIKEHFYGEYHVTDEHGVLTGEYHGKEWGEEWYEKYGKFLRFDDVDEIVNFAWERGVKRETGGSVKLSNEKYNVEISFDDTYTPGSADNKNVYDKVFNPFCIPGRQKYFKVLDISISDKMGGKLRAAVICEYMTFSDNCIIRENDLVIMSENDLISFGLERAEICRVKSLDIGGETLGLYPYKDGFIIHGETEIAGVSGDFELLWSFSGEDIFATLDGSSAFEMDGDGITARDFSGKVYRIGYDGRKI